MYLPCSLPTQGEKCYPPTPVALTYNSSSQLARMAMRYGLLPLSYLVASPSRRRITHFRTKMAKCRATMVEFDQPKKPSRRSAGYHPTIWSHRVIESIGSSYTGVEFDSRLTQLVQEVRSMLESHTEPVALLQLIDSIQRLGVAYHFEEEIQDVLNQIGGDGFKWIDTLYGTALCFRLLRQHGHDVSCDVFCSFRYEKTGFKNCLVGDVKGLLSLYEASCLAVSGEQILEEAREFSLKQLKPLGGEQVDLDLEDLVRHSLEIPLHWRMPRLEAKHYIDFYKKEEGMSPVLLELAKLDFNIVQSIHQEELKELSRWWEILCLAKKLNFSRDRLVENYLWAAGIASEPHLSKCRKGLTKVICFISIVDDMYDIYGSLEELSTFTKSIKSWDSKVLETLPNEFKLCYSALYNLIEEIAYDVLKDHGLDVMPFHMKEWERLCGAYLREAEWLNKGYHPTLKEYLDNACVSIGGPMVMIYAYYLRGETLGVDSMNYVQQGPDVNQLIYWSSLITRLCDDLGTSEAEMERGDISKSVQCLMNETSESEETSIEYIQSLVDQTWKELNREGLRSPLPRSFVSIVLNMARTAHCIYQHGDGIGTSTGITKNRIKSLFMEPVPLK